MRYVKYYVRGLQYGWRMAQGRDKVLFFTLATFQLVLLPGFICLPSYRAQVKEWWESQ